jgi:hypothetical protein
MVPITWRDFLFCYILLLNSWSDRIQMLRRNGSTPHEYVVFKASLLFHHARIYIGPNIYEFAGPSGVLDRAFCCLLGATQHSNSEAAAKAWHVTRINGKRTKNEKGRRSKALDPHTKKIKEKSTGAN